MAAFTTPVKTWAAEVLSIVDINTYIRDNLQYLYDNRLAKIAESIPGGAVASVNFASIPQTYRSLLFSWQARGDNATASVSLVMQANGDTAANYDSELYQFHGSVSGPFVQESIATATPAIGDLSAASAPAGFAGGGVIEIQNYAGVTFNKSATGRSSFKGANTTGNINHEIEAWFWRNSAAITSLLLKPSAGNFIAGSSFQLYGLM
jgi:hypothetical protein